MRLFWGDFLLDPKCSSKFQLAPETTPVLLGYNPWKLISHWEIRIFQYEIHLQMLEFPLSCLFSVVKINLKWILQKKRTPQVPLGQPAKVRERRLSKKSIVYWPYIPGCWERYYPCMMLFQKWHAEPSKDVIRNETFSGRSPRKNLC